MDLGKELALNPFTKMGVPSDAIYRVCQCIEKRKTAKRKAESGRQAVKMPEKKRSQLVQAIYLGSHLKETGSKFECWQVLCRRNCEGGCSAVMTYRRAIGPDFSQELEQRQERACQKKIGQNILLEPHRRRGGPSCSPITSFCRGFLGCPPAGGWKGRLAWTQN